MRTCCSRVIGPLAECLGHVDNGPDPEPCGGKIEWAHEGQGSLVVSSGHPAHLLDAVALPIALPVLFSEEFYSLCMME